MRLLLVLATFVALSACRAPRTEEESDVPSGPSKGERETQDELVGRSAKSGGAGTQSVTTRIGFYHTPDDGEGNPFLDEELTVIEPIVIYHRNVNEQLDLTAKLSYDYVSSASIDRLSKFPEQSGATGDNYLGLDFGVQYKLSDFMRIGGHAGFSTEYDYNSANLGGSLSIDSEDRNSTYTFSLDTFFDRIDIIRFDGTETEGTDDRFSVAGAFNWYRAISPNMHGEFGTLVSFQSGFLETPYNAVVIEDPALPPNPNLDNMARGTEVTEELPSSRLRGAIYGRVRRFLQPGRAVELGGRFYTDSWGIVAFSLEPRLYQDLSDTLRLQVGYRFYVQSEADDYAASFTMAPIHRTQDSDLGDFMSHGISSRLFWTIGDRHTLDFGLGYTFRDDGLDRIFASIGWKFTW